MRCRRFASIVAFGVLASIGGGTACLEAPQSRVEYSAVAVTTGHRTIAVGSWDVTLDRAAVAFGPAYFCAAASGSSTLCATALGEVASTVQIDALAAGPTPLGRVTGFTGHIESVSYDLGILWLDTQQQPNVSTAAPGGHSLELSGTATKGGVRVPFVARVDVVPQFQGQRAVATAPAVGDVDSSDVVLEVHLDPVRWLAQIDFEAAAAKPERPLVFAPGSPEHGAILVGLKNLAPIEFRWAPVKR